MNEGCFLSDTETELRREELLCANLFLLSFNFSAPYFVPKLNSHKKKSKLNLTGKTKKDVLDR